MCGQGLRLRALAMRFGAVQALAGIDLEVAQGERRVLLGTNGAGKTTLFNLIAGELQPTQGLIEWMGRPLAGLAPHQRARLGVARTYQSSALLETLSVRDNLVLAVLGARGRQWGMWPLKGGDGAVLAAVAQARAGGLGALLDSSAGLLSHGQRRQLEIAMALAQQPRLLLLDEPAAGLSPAERPALIASLRALPRSLTLLMIEHDMDVALALADRVTVMRDGRIVAEGTPAQVRADPAVQAIYLGGGGHG
jgi:branched-chain amino acid transport system ATP-binding protein